LYAAITAADIPYARAHARMVSDWPGGAMLAGFGGCAPAGWAFLTATLFVFTPLPIALALFETVLVVGAFDTGGFVAVPSSARFPDVADVVATALRVVDFLGRAFVVAVFATAAFRAAVFPAPARCLEPATSLGLAISVAVSAAFGSTSAALCPPGLRPDVAFLAARCGSLVALTALVPKASATTASASSNVS
jgi:hypothetical protein